MSMSAVGLLRRSRISGMRLWPPAITFASSPNLSSSDGASSTEPGRAYSNAAGIIRVPP